MREIEETEFKKIANDILKFIKQVCDKNKIPFFLAYGTAIGALRHQGFIPWDDDIDIVMFRADYEKFAKVMREEKNDRYKLLYIDTKTYTLPLAKVVDNSTVLHQTRQREYMNLGIYVDVFILDNIPEDEKKQRKYFSTLDVLTKWWKVFQYKREYTTENIISSIKKVLYETINPRMFACMIDKTAKRFKNTDSSLVGCMTYVDGNRAVEICDKEWFQTSEKVIFEGEQYRVCGGYEEYLRKMYGDWRTLPPEEQRVSQHLFSVYYREENDGRKN